MRGFTRNGGSRPLGARCRPSGRWSDDALVPLINVVFLMMIFFMLAGTIRPADPLVLNRPISDQGSPEEAGDLIEQGERI
jgi:biopolymer transport protein ExbD